MAAKNAHHDQKSRHHEQSAPQERITWVVGEKKVKKGIEWSRVKDALASRGISLDTDPDAFAAALLADARLPPGKRGRASGGPFQLRPEVKEKIVSLYKTKGEEFRNEKNKVEGRYIDSVSLQTMLARALPEEIDAHEIQKSIKEIQKDGSLFRETGGERPRKVYIGNV